MPRHAPICLALFLAAGVLEAAEPTPALVEKGRELYVANGCRMCHSAEGKGNVKGIHDGVANRLEAADIKRWLTKPEEMLKKAKSRRKLSMPSFTHLSADEQDALVAYLHSLKPPAK